MTEKQFISNYRKRQRASEKYGARLFYRALLGQIKDVEQALKTMGNVNFLNPETLVSNKRIEEAFLKFYFSQGLPYSQAMFDYIVSQIEKKKEVVPIDPNQNTAVGFWNEAWKRKIREYLYATSYQAIKQITDTTVRLVKQIFIEAQGLSINETAQLLITKGTQFSETRAYLIARTETTKLANFAHATAADSIIGVPLQKKWLSFIDARTRTDHISANGQMVAKDGLFNIGGQKMAYPGDGSHGAGADQICNCRCVVSYTVIR
jgi:hypothetical protein